MLSKITAGFAVLFMVGALILAIAGQRGPGSLMSGTAASPPPAPSSAPRGPNPTPRTPTGAPPPAGAPTGQTPPAQPPK